MVEQFLWKSRGAGRYKPRLPPLRTFVRKGVQSFLIVALNRKFRFCSFILPTLPREIAPPKKKPGILPPRTISRQGGTISRESRGQPLLSLLHTKTATPLQYEKLSPPHFFPRGDNFTGEGRHFENKSSNKSRVAPCSRKKQQNSGFMFPFFSFFWVGFFALFRAFRALPSL